MLMFYSLSAWVFELRLVQGLKNALSCMQNINLIESDLGLKITCLSKCNKLLWLTMGSRTGYFGSNSGKYL